MTQHFALVGTPIARSPSPAMHNAAFQTLALDADYGLRPADVGDEAAVLAELRDGLWQGLNVTTPLKTLLAKHVRCLGDAGRAGAVNTLWREGHAVVGVLTDIEGVELPLRDKGLSGGAALILGAGGAARAAALALERLDLVVHIAARRPQAAAELLASLALRRPGNALALDDAAALAAALPAVNLVLNATPAGKIAGDAAWSIPWAAGSRGLVAFDMSYLPRRTVFLDGAAAHGHTTVEGWQMLVAQGAAAFERFTGRPAPVAVMRAAVHGHLLKVS